MAVRATVSRFPVDTDAREGSGLLWGVTVTPFAAVDENGHSPAFGSGGDILPRCENCWAYFNTYCELEQWAWSCSLCGTLNGLSSAAVERYSLPKSCAEMCSSFVDLELPLDGSSEEAAMQARPVYVAAVDLSSSEEFLELTKSALLAALEALAPGSLFGLATFSHKLGLYDIQGPIPVVKNVFIPPDAEGTLPIGLDDVMPLLQFLAPVDTCKDHIASALETLRPTTSWERTTAAGQSLDGVLIGGRGFGVAMEALCNYLGSEYGNTFALGLNDFNYKTQMLFTRLMFDFFNVNFACLSFKQMLFPLSTAARIFAFLSGPPDYGAGQLDTRRYGEQYASKGEDADRALLPEQTPFYKDLYTDLASLKFLSIESGGSLFLYTSTEDSTLPQDMYRMLSRPYAFGCVLRLRTSTEFKPGNSSDVPTIQIAFQYSVVVPPEELSNLAGVSTNRTIHSLKRRLRIRTLQFGVAENINELYDSCDPEVVLSLLVHKVILASLDEGVREGRVLLQEWLVILIAQYNDALKLVQYNSGLSLRSQIDVAFSQCPQLQPLPRLIFALLRNPLLRFHEEGVHPDYRIYLQCLFSVLEPSSLHRAVYPVLTSFATPDKQAYPRHSLSRAALITSGSPIFFLDAFTILVVFYSSTADPSLPFPPPHDCLLRITINKLKQERCITPKLIFIRGGLDDASVFENFLIEEQDVDGSGLTSVMGFVSFLEDITQKVLEFMK
ncbi:hypothetical protein Ahy_A03g017040 isoform G [Arachis hypogaea]|uniref:Sec23/Sec24 trunk domain-containing protein n=1 Tax=Arachis hypogaea TaxID=3818 RepID=A0A445E544_ARAHY|nr:hypothetical protein Ahy_A03g017040 isoform G [Arachis hypogaea]